ncbi:head-tail adaptor protein [Novosphingopyxis sp. YJ-S2-01]|uniref:head-tail adaptor protein n=1 Tax=Novosphingopyxis sp. YJ-S2-01 TaxID=2794021 RepID=UPI0018DBDD8A|nr:head-tail adaptor protein [Novosphingopyxis sp. YJ-S2-01]MBH9537523.1 head-tail adaptor protein [Novosphingopyxis sp. YJ-S2-01]
MKAGPRDDLITFQRYKQTENSFGEPEDADEPTAIGEAYAEVIYGKGSERREAAKESAKVPATFRVRANTLTRSIRTGDQIAFDGAVWDIESNVPLDRDGREITATRLS